MQVQSDEGGKLLRGTGIHRLCSLKSSALKKNLVPEVQRQLDDLLSLETRYKNGDYIFSAREQLAYIAEVTSGVLKAVIKHSNGKESITGFYLPGEIVGLDGICASEHAYHIVSVGASSVNLIDYDKLMHVAWQSNVLQEQFIKAISANSNNLLLRLQNQTAESKIASFLLDMSVRNHVDGIPASQYDLLIPRKDVANYLGLAAETVSRVFQSFQSHRLLDTNNKKVILLDKDKIYKISGSSN